MTRIAGPSKTTHGFTLIELLVVISIIALLIAMLLPTLSRARDNAEIVQCLANLRQIGIGWHGYTMDHDDRIVSVLGAAIVYGQPGWYGTIQNSGQGRPFGHFLQPYVAPYVHNNRERTSDVWYCPTNEKKGVLTSGVGQHPMSSNYGANGQYGRAGNPDAAAASNQPRNLRTTDIHQHLSRRPIVYDGIIRTSTHYDQPYASLVPNTPFAVSEYMAPQFHIDRWAHQGAWNVLWADGHASTNLPDALASGLWDYDLYGGWSNERAHVTFNY